jgi:integrase
MAHKTQTVNFNLKNVSNPNAYELIYFISIIKGVKVKVSTGQKALVKSWNKELQRCNTGSLYTQRDNKHSKKVNTFLDGLVEDSKRQYTAFMNSATMYQTPDDFKKRIQFCIRKKIENIVEDEKKESIKPLQYFEVLIKKMPEKIIKSKGTFIEEKTIEHHKTVFKRIKSFFKDNGKIDSFSVFNKFFESEFENWGYTKKNYANNTIPATFSVLKVWLNEAENEGLITDKSFHNYRSKGTDVDNIYLTLSEIDKIYKLNIKQLMDNNIIAKSSKTEITRDLFIISCYTGLRFTDLGLLNKGVWDLVNNNLIIIPNKTKDKVYIPLHKTVIELYNKYNGILPKPIDKSKANQQLHKLGKLAGIDSEVVIKEIKGGKVFYNKFKKYEKIGNHTGRRSYATNMYLTGAPTIGIMKITGHSTEINFMKYIKLSKEENAQSMQKYIDKLI